MCSILQAMCSSTPRQTEFSLAKSSVCRRLLPPAADCCSRLPPCFPVVCRCALLPPVVAAARRESPKMFGISYGELFLILGATAALIGPKDLPVVARTAGRLAGRAIGYVQLARGQFENIMQQSEASKVHKELRDTLAQIEAIRYEMRSISHMNPGPFIRRLDGGETRVENGCEIGMNSVAEHKPTAAISKDINKENSAVSNLHSQAIAFANLAESQTVKSTTVVATKLLGDNLITVLPVCAETAKLLPKRTNEPKGSDIMLDAILEAEVACNAKQFFSQPQNQISDA